MVVLRVGTRVLHLLGRTAVGQVDPRTIVAEAPLAAGPGPATTTTTAAAWPTAVAVAAIGVVFAVDAHLVLPVLHQLVHRSRAEQRVDPGVWLHHARRRRPVESSTLGRAQGGRSGSLPLAHRERLPSCRPSPISGRLE